MIDIRTNGGVYLDLAPDAEFEIEMNNPLLESDRIPVAFSTSITFPPSETNCSVFGYLPAMLLPPSNVKRGVTILFCGMPLLTGTLVYDSVDEEGNLVYTFTEKSIEDSLDTKLFKLDLPKSKRPGEHGGWTADELAARLRAGDESGIGAPTLYDPEGSVTKFHNLPLSGETRFTPCVSFARLFSGSDLQLNGVLTNLWNSLSVLGLHKNFSGSIKGYGDYLSIAQSLPDVTLLDLLKEFCKMTCSAVFVSGGVYTVVPFQSIKAMTPIDWNGKIADGHSFATEKAIGYGFGYAKEDNGNDGVTSEEIVEVSTLKEILDARVSGQYTPVLNSNTGDTYSVPSSSIDLGISFHEFRVHADTCEILHVAENDVDNEIEGEKMDNHLSASLIRNVPAFFEREEWDEDDSYPQEGGIWIQTEAFYRMAGLVSFPADGVERNSKIIIGSYASGQFVGKGLGMTVSGADMQIASSLDALTLYDTYHHDFEDWLAKDRQIISVDIDLSTQDIFNFRLWQVVTVRNRLFLVKRLTLHLSSKVNRVLSSVELISL